MTHEEIIRQLRFHLSEANRLSALLYGGAPSAPAEEPFNRHDGFWMTCAQAAHHWGHATVTVERWRKAKMIKAQKVGGRWYYDIRFSPRKP
jgi:hypothetical protein